MVPKPDPDLPAAQDSGRAGDIVPSAAKEAEDSKAGRQTRSRNGRPPDLVVYNPK
jgi:hypothetical protein